MLRVLLALIPALFSSLRSRRELLLESLALRQQLATFVQTRQPLIGPADRRSGWCYGAWVKMGGRGHIIVKPETVFAWHRAGFRFY
jgi:hypothetical protein